MMQPTNTSYSSMPPLARLCLSVGSWRAAAQVDGINADGLEEAVHHRLPMIFIALVLRTRNWEES